MQAWFCLKNMYLEIRLLKPTIKSIEKNVQSSNAFFQFEKFENYEKLLKIKGGLFKTWSNSF